MRRDIILSQSTVASKGVPHKYEQLVVAGRKINRSTPTLRFGHKVDCVIALAQGARCKDVSAVYGHNPRTLRRWLRTADARGIEALREAPRGAPPKLPRETLREIQNAIKAGPQSAGLSAKTWTGPMLLKWIKTRFDKSLSLRHCERMLKAGIIMSPSPKQT